MYYVPSIVVFLLLTLILLSKRTEPRQTIFWRSGFYFWDCILSLIYAVVSGFAIRHPFLFWVSHSIAIGTRPVFYSFMYLL